MGFDILLSVVELKVMQLLVVLPRLGTKSSVRSNASSHMFCACDQKSYLVWGYQVITNNHLGLIKCHDYTPTSRSATTNTAPS